MALYLKQDFNPPVLSRRWIAMKFRPNMLIYSHHHIISILESGLLFREDSLEVEQEAPAADELLRAAGGTKSGWFTRGEKLASVCAVATCAVLLYPKSFHRSTLVYLSACTSLPVIIRTVHRVCCRGNMSSLLSVMRDYLALARRAAACLRDCTQLHSELNSVVSVLESMHTMLCRQQSELAAFMSRVSSALLGNAPWLRSDVAWHAVQREPNENLLKIHHAFLVVQSTLLKHIAMAHYMPTTHAQKIYKNHNERIYWIHNTLIRNLIGVFTENYEALERMYRLLKNIGSCESITNKRPGVAITDSWLYSDVHSGIARANLELKVALNKCNNLDMFLDSCALDKQDLNLEVLNNDVDNLIDDVTKCLSTIQAAQIRLKKLQNKFGKSEVKEKEADDVVENGREILTVGDGEPETRDEVFYFVKTEEDDVNIQPSGDITTGPGRKEKETTKIVLSELKRKLVKREDLMRERERQALVKTMPELEGNVPEFERQINVENQGEGFISKVPKKKIKRRLFRKYKIQKNKYAPKYKLKVSKYDKDIEISNVLYKANSNLTFKSKLLTFFKDNKFIYVTNWSKRVPLVKPSNKIETNDYSDLSEGLSDVETSAISKVIVDALNHAIHDENHRQNGLENGNSRNHRENNWEVKDYRYSKRELDLTPSSESDSDFGAYKERQLAVLKDVRKHRAERKKNHPSKRSTLTLEKTIEDESLRPIEYSLGTGLALASVLRTGQAALGREDVFIGDGEVSQDSGNDEDA